MAAAYTSAPPASATARAWCSRGPGSGPATRRSAGGGAAGPGRPRSPRGRRSGTAPLEGPPGAVPPVGPLAGVAVHDLDALLLRHRRPAPGELLLRQVGVGVEHGGHDLDLGVGVPIEQGDLGVVARREPTSPAAPSSAPSSPNRASARSACRCSFPGTGQARAPVLDVDPLHPGGDHLAQLGQHQVGVVAGFGERVGPHPDQERFVGLAAGVDAQVGGGRRRQQPRRASKALARTDWRHTKSESLGLWVPGREPGLQHRQATRRRRRRAGPCRRRSGRRAASRGFGAGNSGSGRSGAGCRRRHSGSTSPCTP